MMFTVVESVMRSLGENDTDLDVVFQIKTGPFRTQRYQCLSVSNLSEARGYLEKALINHIENRYNVEVIAHDWDIEYKKAQRQLKRGGMPLNGATTDSASCTPAGTAA